MDRWSGKVALVTGTSAGIGAAIVTELVKYGVKVVAVARRVEKVEALKKTVKGPGEVHALKADVSKEEDILSAFKWIKSKFGKIHILVNNAGVYRPGMIADADPKYFRDVIETNIMGLTLCTQQAVKLMRETGVNDGHIININSVFGHKIIDFGDPTSNVYPASKFAVTAITETTRQELRFLKTKIRVTSISPGFVATEIVEAGMKAIGVEANPEEMAKLADIPALQPQDVAEAVIYALGTPARVQIQELTIKAVGELF